LFLFFGNAFSKSKMLEFKLRFEWTRVWRESRQAVKVVTVVPTKPRPLIRISGETVHW
jgi:hypothetical protein